MEEEYPDELVDDEENNGSVAEEVVLDDKGEDPLGEKGELGREAEHTVIVVEVTSTFVKDWPENPLKIDSWGKWRAANR